MFLAEKDLKQQDFGLQIPDLCKERLLGYAESFRELSGMFGGEFVTQKTDRKDYFREHSIWENRQLISHNLQEISKIMAQMAGEVFSYRPMEERRSRKIIRGLREERILAKSPCYIMKNNVETIGVLLSTEQKGGISGEYIADYLSILLHRRLKLSLSSPEKVDSQERRFLFVEEPEYICLTGFARVVKDREEISGDNYSIIEMEKGKLTILLSDGTGSGEKACLDSSLVLDVMERFLETGYNPEPAIHLVNAALFSKEDTIGHPTLDLCNIDLYNGVWESYKCGGCASFLKRGNRVRRINGGSLPLGFFRQSDICKEQGQLEGKEYLILMTDGVLEAIGDREEHMEDFLRGITEENPREIAEKMMQRAIMANEGHIRDDMTIVVAGIWEREENE